MSLRTSFVRGARHASFVLPLVGLALIAGCAEEISGPTPRVSSPTDPRLVCNVQLDTPVTLTGSGFSPLAVDVASGPARLVLPEVALVHTAGLDGAAVSDATPIVVPGEDPATTQVHWLSQSQMVLDVTESLALPVGVHAVEVENPNGGKTRFEGALVAVPPPVLERIEPVLFCTAQRDTILRVIGRGLLEVAGDTPTVTLSAGGMMRTYDATTLTGCTTLPAPASDARTCTGFTITIPEGDLAPGTYSAVATNPAPAACSSTAPVSVLIVPPPTLTQVEPMAICTAQGDSMLRITGSDLLEIGGDVPTITLSDGATSRTYDAMSLKNCTDLSAPAMDARSCTEFTIVVPAGDLPPGTYTAVVTNPAPADCSSEAAITLEVVPPPDLRSIAPSRICTGGGAFMLGGTGFRAGATVTAGTLTAASVDVATGGEAATAMFGLGLDPGTYDVTIANPEGCTDTLPAAVTVVEGPILFWVDPSVVYDGITTQITLYASGVSASTSITSVAITAEDGTRTALTYTRDGRGRIQALLPIGTAAGTYDVAIEADGCPAILPDGLRVTDTLSLMVDRVEAPFGWRDEPTAVTFFGSGFTSTPRVYLNPDVPSPTTVATPLLSVGFVDGTRLTAQVPPGLPAGVYDVFVVNPDGAVGLLDQGFTVTAAAPPVLDSVSPGQVDSGAVRTIAVTGSGFATPTAAWTCRDIAGGTMMLAGTVTASTATTASVTLNTGTLGAGTVCVLRLTNPDGTYGDYSAVAITTPASNLQPFRASSALGTPRRAPAVTSGRATRAARFVYALGGDNGTVAGALSSTEAAPVDPFGALGAWLDIPGGLPANRTLARVTRIGRFLYLVGGNDGTAAIADVSRAEILDPGEAPIVTDVSARRGMGMGLGAGVWTYRVAAVYGATDPQNPGGESLASDPVPVRLPAGLPDVLRITLDWSEVPGAVAYRVYRSPMADAGVGSEQLVAEVAARSFEDDGRAPIEARGPLPLGAHGRWAAMPSLGTARSGFGLAVALNPGEDQTEHYLYAIGGRSSAGAPLASYEFLTVRVTGPRTHTVTPTWTPGATNLGVARADLAAYSVDTLAAPIVAAPLTYIYAGGGAGTAGSVSNVDVGAVQEGGQLTAWSAVDASRNASGYAAAAGNGFLYLFGGGPTPSASCFSAEICTGGAGCAGPPDLRNWNNEGISLMTPRYLSGSATESSFIYVVGGTTGAGALATTEQTVL